MISTCVALGADLLCYLIIRNCTAYVPHPPIFFQVKPWLIKRLIQALDKGSIPCGRRRGRYEKECTWFLVGHDFCEPAMIAPPRIIGPPSVIGLFYISGTPLASVVIGPKDYFGFLLQSRITYSTMITVDDDNDNNKRGWKNESDYRNHVCGWYQRPCVSCNYQTVR